MFIRVYIYIHILSFVCTYIYIYVHTRMYMYIYIHILLCLCICLLLLCYVCNRGTIIRDRVKGPIYTNISINAYTHILTRSPLRMCMFYIRKESYRTTTYTYVCIYIYMCVSMYMYVCPNCISCTFNDLQVLHITLTGYVFCVL